MEPGTKIYCINESVYPQHLTKGKEYVIQDLKPEQFRIKTNQEKLAWFPSHCFRFDEVPEIVSIHVDDEIRDPKNDCVEVTIHFSNGEKRWTTFVTTTYLNGLLESENYLVFPKCIIVQELNEPEMRTAIFSLDKQNELMEVSHSLRNNETQETMFTADQIKTAHSKVRSGADFPSYIREIKSMGVTHYESYVADGHIDYHGANNHTAKVPAKYNSLTIAEHPNIEQFKADLKAHQQGKTDYVTFCSDCAKSGVEKWIVRMAEMTCTYFDKAGNELLVEEIPH